MHIEEYITLLVHLGGWEPTKARTHARKWFFEQYGKTPEEMAEENKKKWDEMCSDPSQWKPIIYKASNE